MTSCVTYTKPLPGEGPLKKEDFVAIEIPPCPFCGAGHTEISTHQERRKFAGYVDLRHWCVDHSDEETASEKGNSIPPMRFIMFRDKTTEAVIAAWSQWPLGAAGVPGYGDERAPS